MGERTSHPPGAFSWAELVTSDADAAKAFYTQHFGWAYEDNPVGEGQVYSMALRDGKHVAALFAADQPPHWNCYVTVASADETAERAAAGGATIVAEPFDVMDSGRMAVFVDPTGAGLCVWEPRRHIGATLVNAPGSMTWSDLVTPDADAAMDFYGRLFGWTVDEEPDSGGYRVIFNGERDNAGIFPMEGPSNWIPYFGHEDVDRLAAEVETVHHGPMDLNGGRVAMLGDPQGAVFAVWTGHYDA
jgi:predicted enzyme related to lactoylglutathione lyase